MTDFAGVVSAWEQAAQSPMASQHIHPSGHSAEEYEQSGKVQADEVVEIINAYLPDARHLADFACGDGRVSRHLMKLFEEPSARYLFDVDGLDSSRTMLDRFFEATARHGILWDGMGPWFGSPYDLVFAFAVFIHHDIATGYELLKNLASMVRPGGLVLVNIPIYDSSRERASWCDVTVWTATQLDEAAEAAGLTVETTWLNPGAFSYDNVGPNHGRLHVLRR